MRNLLILFVILFSFTAEAQTLELETVSIEGSEFETYSKKTNFPVEYQSSVSLNHYSPSDILVTFHNVTLNNSSDNRVELFHYPSYLLSRMEIVSESPNLEILVPEIETDLFTSISVNTIKDFSIYLQYNKPFLKGFMFGSESPGDFSFYNSKGEIQKRENNSNYRVGAGLNPTYRIGEVLVKPFLYYSHFTRGVGGLTEFPKSYHNAIESGNLFLFNATLLVNHKEWLIEPSLSYRVQSYNYNNPNTKFSNGGNSGLIDQSLEAKLEASYETFTVEVEDRVSFYSSKIRNEFLLKPKYRGEKVSIELPLLVEEELYPQYNIDLKLLFLDKFLIDLYSYRRVRLPSFNERYFRNEFVHGSEDLEPQCEYKVGTSLELYLEKLNLSAKLEYSYTKNLIRFLQDTPNLFVAHNLPDTHVLSIFSKAEFFIEHFSSFIEYNYNYSNVSGFKLPLFSEHTVKLGLSLEYNVIRAKVAYQYASPKYLQFSNTSKLSSDSNLSFDLSYKINPVVVIISLDNLLDTRRESNIQNPLPRFTASFTLQLSI